MASFKDPEDEKNVFLALVDQLPKPPVPRACTNSTYSGTPANVPTTYISPYSSHAPAVNPFTTNTTNTENPDLADLLERIDDLTEKNGELAREVTRIKNLNSGLVRQHKLDDENIDQLNQYADQVETECRELTRTNRELQLDLVNTRVVRDKLQADLANTRIERDSALVANEGHLNIKRLHGELMNTSKELEEANKRIKNYELWFIGQSHGPTIMGPITPPRHKGDVAFAVPSTPEKSILHLNGSKVRSVEMELKRKVDLYNLEHGTNHQANKYQQNPAKTAWTDKHGVYCEVMDGLPFAAPEHRAMVDINEFNKLEAAQCGPEVYKMYGSDAGINDDNDNNDGIDDDDDDYGPPPTPSPKFRPANTTTKKKVVAKKVVEMKNVVPKKQAARKKTTNGSVAKQKPIAIYDSDDNNTIIVESEDEEPRLPSRRRGATAQAQNAMEDEEETEDEDVHNGDYQRYAAFSQNWRFDCICKTKDQAAIKAADVECTKCRAWSHQMCYGYDSQEVDNENFIHLCPTCHLESLTTRKTTTNKKRRRGDENTTSNKKSKQTAEHTEGGKGKMKWTEREKKHLCHAMREHFRRADAGECDRLYDLKLFAVLSEMINESGGVNRNANACKNEWNRSCREISGLDERKVPNYAKLSTSLQ